MKGTFLRLALKNSILFKFIFRKSVISNGLNHLLHLTIAMVTIYTYLLHTNVPYVIFHVYYTSQNKKNLKVNLRYSFVKWVVGVGTISPICIRSSECLS